KSGNEYALTPDTAAFLNRHSPAYMGSAIGFLLYPEHVRRYDTVADAVRKGGAAVEDDTIATPDSEMWVTFAESMGKLQTLTSELLANVLHVEGAPRLKVLDVAAGHGMFGIALAKRNPHAEIIALDWQNVLEVAKKYAEQHGVAQNWRALPGSAFDVDFGKDYDLVLLTNFIHHFDKPTTEKLLKKVHASLSPNGRVAILDFIPNEDRVSPPMAATFPLTMLVGTAGGDAYTRSEYQHMLKSAGFNREELHDLPPSFFRAIVAGK
ncbi:MAG: class I SAM-dependent methyltransferase, partial [Terriglobales bacterium]